MQNLVGLSLNNPAIAEREELHWVVEREGFPKADRWYAGIMPVPENDLPPISGLTRKHKRRKYTDYFFDTKEEAERFING